MRIVVLSNRRWRHQTMNEKADVELSKLILSGGVAVDILH
jgi:hypothetical protein